MQAFFFLCPKQNRYAKIISHTEMSIDMDVIINRLQPCPIICLSVSSTQIQEINKIFMRIISPLPAQQNSVDVIAMGYHL